MSLIFLATPDSGQGSVPLATVDAQQKCYPPPLLWSEPRPIKLHWFVCPKWSRRVTRDGQWRIRRLDYVWGFLESWGNNWCLCRPTLSSHLSPILLSSWRAKSVSSSLSLTASSSWNSSNSAFRKTLSRADDPSRSQPGECEKLLQTRKLTDHLVHLNHCCVVLPWEDKACFILSVSAGSIWLNFIGSLEQNKGAPQRAEKALSRKIHKNQNATQWAEKVSHKCRRI